MDNRRTDMNRTEAPQHNKTRRPALAAFFAMAVAIVFEAIPGGAVLRFVSDPAVSQTSTEVFSCFDLTPFGYANFGPFLTALLTVVTAALYLAGSLAKKKGLVTAALVTNVIAIFTSLMPLVMFGGEFYPTMLLGITLILLGGAVLGAAALVAAKPPKLGSEKIEQ